MLMLYVRWKDRRIERNGLVIEKLRTFQGGNRPNLNIKATVWPSRAWEPEPVVFGCSEPEPAPYGS